MLSVCCCYAGIAIYFIFLSCFLVHSNQRVCSFGFINKIKNEKEERLKWKRVQLEKQRNEKREEKAFIQKQKSHRYKFLYACKHSKSFRLSWLLYHELTIFFIMFAFHLLSSSTRSSFSWFHDIYDQGETNVHESNKFAWHIFPIQLEI